MDTEALATSTAQPQLAGWWRRLVGYWLDGIFCGVIGGIIGFGLGASGWVGGSVLFGTIVGVVYWVFFVGHDGATVGMRILGMRVVPSDGRPKVTYVDAFVRYLMMLVGGWCLALGFLWAAWDSRRQGWHDHVAKTLVVRT